MKKFNLRNTFQSYGTPAFAQEGFHQATVKNDIGNDMTLGGGSREYCFSVAYEYRIGVYS